MNAGVLCIWCRICLTLVHDPGTLPHGCCRVLSRDFREPVAASPALGSRRFRPPPPPPPPPGGPASCPPRWPPPPPRQAAAGAPPPPRAASAGARGRGGAP